VLGTFLKEAAVLISACNPGPRFILPPPHLSSVHSFPITPPLPQFSMSPSPPRSLSEIFGPFEARGSSLFAPSSSTDSQLYNVNRLDCFGALVPVVFPPFSDKTKPGRFRSSFPGHSVQEVSPTPSSRTRLLCLFPAATHSSFFSVSDRIKSSRRSIRPFTHLSVPVIREGGCLGWVEGCGL